MQIEGVTEGIPQDVNCTANTPLHIKLDPRTNILLILTVSCILVSGGTDGVMKWVRLSLALLPLVLFLATGRTKSALKYAGVYMAAYFAEIIVAPQLTGVSNFLVTASIGLISHIMPGLLMGYYFMSTTKVAELIGALEKIHIPRIIIWPLCIVFRFFPTVKEELEAVKDALRMKGMTLKRIVFHPLLYLEYIFVPLIISVVKIGDELMMASLTRGFKLTGQRTNICEIGFGILDILAFVFASVIWILFIWAG